MKAPSLSWRCVMATFQGCHLLRDRWEGGGETPSPGRRRILRFGLPFAHCGVAALCPCGTMVCRCAQNHLGVEDHLGTTPPMNRRARRAAGRKSKKASRGAETSASSAAAFCSEAFTQLKAGRLLDAQVSCQQALAIDPAHTDGLHLMGRLALETGQHDHAVEWLRRAMASAPRADCAGLL